MDDKYYKPIMKDGDHLVRSTKNPDRVRGVTRDKDNKHPDIIEWEEIGKDDLQDKSMMLNSFEENYSQLTPEQEQIAQEIGDALANILIEGGYVFFQKVIAPWCKDTAWPWLKGKGRELYYAVVQGKDKDIKANSNSEAKMCASLDKQLEAVSAQLDDVFDQLYIDLDSEEAQHHFMRLIYHMLGIVNEIRILSNARIRKESSSKEDYLSRREESEIFLSEKVAECLNQLLSEKDLPLDLKTSMDLFSLTGGGVRLNGEYAPVQATKISEALKMIQDADSQS